MDNELRQGNVELCLRVLVYVTQGVIMATRAWPDSRHENPIEPLSGSGAAVPQESRLLSVDLDFNLVRHRK